VRNTLQLFLPTLPFFWLFARQKAISSTAWKLKSICHRWLLLVKVRERDARECPLKVEGRRERVKEGKPKKASNESRETASNREMHTIKRAESRRVAPERAFTRTPVWITLFPYQVILINEAKEIITYILSRD